MQSSASAFNYLRSFVHRNAGIKLSEDKQYLIETRLRSVVEAESLGSLDALVQVLSKRVKPTLEAQVIEALTTNETSFFRDGHPFRTIQKKLLPELIEAARPRKQLRIWSAACSTGQEPYTLAMILDAHFPELADWKVEILATDINQQVLERAKQGVFTQLEVGRGLPAIYLAKYFKRAGARWKLQSKIAEKVRFRALNLTNPWPSGPKFDMILIRNVLIYFDEPTKQRVLERACARLKPMGLLVLGAAENGQARSLPLSRVDYERTTVYKSKLR